jgi:long-chain acyl-CoA synthetase
VQYKPQFIFAVPRLFETIYRGVLNKFATEKPGKRKIINFFTKVTMAHVQATRTLRGLVIRDAPPSPIEKVGHSLSLSLVACLCCTGLADARVGVCLQLFALLVVVALSPLRAVGDKLVWSKVRAGFGGKVSIQYKGSAALQGG